ncbi:anthocyanidin-3-O-glucoside rhamnosyltransferase-like [Aristolochia californica]|uniref:anthocyanidin-3-O-glucoside rhamnosyltransferase-like n=1 Tax=Aristolochia californica TaxID=171875 RepID=UPI0035E138C6
MVAVARDGSAASEVSLHVAMFPWFAFGHIGPFVQLANKIAAHGVRVSFFSAPGNIPRISSALESSPCHPIAMVPVQIPAVDGLPPGAESTAEVTPAMAELLKLATDKMAPQIETLLVNLRPDVILFDFGMQWLPPIAHRLGVKSLFFSVFSAISSAYLTVPSRLIDGHPPTAEDLKGPPPGLENTTFPTLKTYESRDFLYLFKSFSGPCVFDRVTACMEVCDAILSKTCMEMEGPYVKYVQSQYKKPILLTGPVVPEPPFGELDNQLAEWLSRFPEKSVIFCSFGSETFLKDDQIKELAWGLEMTGSPFILVLNFPENGESMLKEVLPEGFQEKVKEKGIVKTGWVQQQLIMAHPSVGYFVCHAGLSSIIEGLISDLQLVLLPQKGDQFLNSKLVVWDLKAGVEVNRKDEDGFFTQNDLCEAVKSAMASARGKYWRDFLSNKEIQDGFTKDLVKKMKEMVMGFCGRE